MYVNFQVLKVANKFISSGLRSVLGKFAEISHNFLVFLESKPFFFFETVNSDDPWIDQTNKQNEKEQ